MIDTSLLLTVYLELNLLLLAVWGMHRLSTGLSGFFGWNFSYASRLQTLRITFILIFLIPVLFWSIPALIHPDISEHLQKPVQFVQVSLSNLGAESLEGANTALTQTSVISLNYFQIVLLFLFSGFVILLLRLVVKVIRLKRVIQNAYCWKRIKSLHIHVSNEIRIPFSTRIFGRNQIVIPEGLFLESDCLAVILAHEGWHLRNSDANWEILMELCQLIFFWNPFVYLWRAEFSLLQEYACDEGVISAGKISQHSYGKCLLHVTEQLNLVQFNPIASSAMAGGRFSKRLSKTNLERRIQMLLENKMVKTGKLKTRFHRLASLGMTAVLGLFIVACTNAEPEEQQIFVEVKILKVDLKAEYQGEIGLMKKVVLPDDGPTLEFEDFQDFENLLQEYGEVEVVAFPKVTTLNQQLARIESGQSQPGLVDDTPATSTKIEIDILPELTMQNDITLSLDLTVSSTLASEGSEPAPITVNNIKTSISLSSGKIVMLSPSYQGMDYIFLVKPSLLDMP